MPLILVLLIVQVALGSEDCPREELLPKINSLLERNYLWWDKVRQLSWKDEKELIENLRRLGDRWTSITKQEEDRLWYSRSRMFGLGLRWDDNGYVTKVFSSSPAERHGLKEGDLIVSINDVSDKSQWRRIIRETERDVAIRLEVLRNGEKLMFEVRKGDFEVPAVEEVKVIREGDKSLGYIKLANFTQPAVEGFSQALEHFRAQNIDVLILDLRDNSGGLISVAKSIADMLIGGDGVMFYLEGRGRNYGVYQFGSRDGLNKPIVVLINKQTASAAELLTALLRRYQKAILVGENTVGKYVGSNLYTLDTCGNVLRLITFEMKLPNGEVITSDRGIEPDCRLEAGEPIQQALQCLSIHTSVGSPSGRP